MFLEEFLKVFRKYEVSTLCTFPGSVTIHLKFASYKPDDYFDEIYSNKKA